MCRLENEVFYFLYHATNIVTVPAYMILLHVQGKYIIIEGISENFLCQYTNYIPNT